MGELTNLGGRKTDAHQQACKHPGLYGRLGMVYWTSIEEGKTLIANCGGSNGSVQWGGQVGENTWQADLPEYPRKLQR